MDARLLVLERDVEGEDEAVLEALGHIRMAGSVVQHQSLDEPRVRVGHVLHLHQLDHVQVDGLELALLARNARRLADRKDRIDNRLSERLRKRLVHLGRQAGVGDLDEGLVRGSGGSGGGRGEGHFERVEERGEGVFGDFEAVGEDAGVDTFGSVSQGLVQELACAARAFSERNMGEAKEMGAPTRRTTLVVPSPVISSCATAVRAINAAVGFCAIRPIQHQLTKAQVR